MSTTGFAFGRQFIDTSLAAECGALVDAAYTLFKSLRERHTTPAHISHIPKGYEVTAWIHMSDFTIFRENILKFYGFMLRHEELPDQHFLVLRGTEGWWEWWDDAVLRPVTFNAAPQLGKVHCGFERIYRTMRLTPVTRATSGPERRIRVTSSPSASFATQVHEHVTAFAKERKEHKLIVAGHSLGGALCTLFVAEHCARKSLKQFQNTGSDITVETLCTFASPRVGLDKFKSAVDVLPVNVWRIVNYPDLVPKAPFEWMGFRHVEQAYEFSSAGRAKLSPICSHDMKTYLIWLSPSHFRVKHRCAKMIERG